MYTMNCLIKRLHAGIEVEGSPKRTRISKSRTDPFAKLDIFKIDDVSKDKTTTTVKVFVNKPVHEQAATKPEDFGQIPKEPADISAAETSEALTSTSLSYDVPKCSKSMKWGRKLPEPPHPASSSAATVCHTYETLNDTGIQQGDNQTHKSPELPSIRIVMVSNSMGITRLDIRNSWSRG